ncbi:hypothetical protein [Curvibacter lanceolatus]|uniref:hypothetical protein n=1 Tax=Curvibacter lanceolatus TaxID=86182 RepID=UPI00035C10B9|nr:hypothetical protein [Curvibacter lanceolatus]
MSLTIEQLEAEQVKLARMIAELKQSAPTFFHIPESHIELKPGQQYAGLVLKDDGSPSHHLILLPGEAEEVNWADAKAWAAKAGGELPTRQEQSLLFANLKGEFKEAWYWSGEQHESSPSCAWGQGFGSGSQGHGHQGSEFRARAVSRLFI